MARYRQIHIEFWQDGFVLDLTPEEKYFYLYLMTNSKTTQCGIYELPKRIIQTETGYNGETVEKLLQRFIEYRKIDYCESTREIMLLNWIKFNWINSVKVLSLIDKELKNVKNHDFIKTFISLCKEYEYSIDTLSILQEHNFEVQNNKPSNNNGSIRYSYGMDSLSIDLGEEREIERELEVEEEREEERELIPFVEIINYLNDASGKNYRSSTKKTKNLIKARWNEGFAFDDFKKVIDIKISEWKYDQNMSKYIRPETLFGNKFEGYLNQNTKIIDEYDNLF
ncbi:conserved phage C-terminal domain-containing protein [Virgibacillus oceani]|uniref:Phage conserved hypothetical protein C-terminal domain-containing protein n=1 Tax=Virgibacillus oceani TaxID=1479511 RepID=A0A917H1I2_9BACI|nr:conserved phage C-terminal domain-containing protein [Virgibacillus oceani]GGG64548.1 hypothetical protein GCM10011398_05190 [Virgibacillus oceani]